MLRKNKELTFLDKNYKITAINLLRDRVLKNGSVKITVRGASMKPLINDGSVVEIRRISRDLEPGMITAVHIEGRIFIHRIIEVSKTGMIKTKGDNLPFSDGYIPVDAVIGEVISVKCNKYLLKPRLLFANLFEYLFMINETFRVLCKIFISKLFYRNCNEEIFSEIPLQVTNRIFNISERIIRLNLKLSRKLRMTY